MAFADFFRPKWKHSDVDIRAEAVRGLGEDDLRILEQVLRGDEDVRVRRIALQKVEDPQLLDAVAESDADKGLRRAAAEKAQALLLRAALGNDQGSAEEALARIAAPKTLVEVVKQAACEPVRQAALRRLSNDERALTDIVRTAGDPALRLQALAHIDDAKLLGDLALRETTRELGTAAVARVSDVAILEEVAQKARNKNVREAARQRLPQRGAEPTRRATAGKQRATAAAPSPEAKRQARQAQLVGELERAVLLDDPDEAEAAIASVQAAWTELGMPDASYQQRFDRALDQHRTRRELRLSATRSHTEALAAERRRDDETLRLAEAREALVAQVEALDGEATEAGLVEAREAWAALPRSGHDGRELEHRFRKACEAARRRSELRLSREHVREQMAALVDEAERIGPPLREAEQVLRKLARRWRELEAAGTDEALRARFQAAEARFEQLRADEQAQRTAEETEAAARLGELSASLEALLVSDDRKRIERELSVARATFESAGGGKGKPSAALEEARARFRSLRDRVGVRLQELRDAENWKRWLNVPQLEKLCEQMEALRDQLAAANLVGGKVVGETGDEGTEGATHEAPEESTEPASEAIATEIASAAAGSATEGAPGEGASEHVTVGARYDVAGAVQRMKALQTEWKQSGPAPRERAEQLWQRFQLAGDEVYQRTHASLEERAEQRAEGMRAREALCEEVEALADSTDWKGTAEKIKALQQQWKDLGPGPRGPTNALWQRFRGACDAFFARRQEHFNQTNAERAEGLAKLQELVSRAEALADSSDWKGVAEQLKALQAEWKAAGPAPRGSSNKLWQQFRSACDRFFSRRNAHFDEQSEERRVGLAKKEELCQRAEALAASLAEATDEAREAALKEAKALQVEWKKSAPAPKEQAEAIWRRFRAACDRVFAPREPEPVPELPPTQPDGTPWPKFENKLNLDGVLARLHGDEPSPAASDESAPPPAAAHPDDEAPDGTP